MRNKNILIGLFGSLAVALVLILMVSRLVEQANPPGDFGS